MPAGHYPLTPAGDNVLVVEPKRRCRGSSCRSQADNPTASITPAKVIRPRLHSGIEQRHFAIGKGIDAVGSGPLIAVAPGAGQPQVALIGGAALRQRNDVLDMHLRAANLLGGLAVTATMFCDDGYPASYGPWNVHHRSVLGEQRSSPAQA